MKTNNFQVSFLSRLSSAKLSFDRRGESPPDNFKDKIKRHFPTPNTAASFKEAQTFLKSYGIDQLYNEMKNDGFWDDSWNLQKCIFSKVVAGKIPQPDFQAAEQASLGEKLGKRYMIAANAPELDAHWNDDSEEWRGKASMSKRHRFLLIRPEAESMRCWFNVLVYGMHNNLQHAVEVLEEVKTAALRMTTACGWSNNIGLFLIIYGHTTCTSPLHIVDLDCAGPSYEMLKFKLLRLDDVIEVLRRQEVAKNAFDFGHFKYSAAAQDPPATLPPQRGPPPETAARSAAYVKDNVSRLTEQDDSRSSAQCTADTNHAEALATEQDEFRTNPSGIDIAKPLPMEGSDDQLHLLSANLRQKLQNDNMHAEIAARSTIRSLMQNNMRLPDWVTAVASKSQPTSPLQKDTRFQSSVSPLRLVRDPGQRTPSDANALRSPDTNKFGLQTRIASPKNSGTAVNMLRCQSAPSLDNLQGSPKRWNKLGPRPNRGYTTYVRQQIDRPLFEAPGGQLYSPSRKGCGAFPETLQTPSLLFKKDRGMLSDSQLALQK